MDDACDICDQVYEFGILAYHIGLRSPYHYNAALPGETTSFYSFTDALDQLISDIRSGDLERKLRLCRLKAKKDLPVPQRLGQ